MGVKKTFSLKKLAATLGPDIITHSLNIMGKRLNKSIQENLDNGIDINGKRFESLSETTKELGGNKPLRRTGNMGKTKLTKATRANPVYTIEMRGFPGPEDDQGRKRKKGARQKYGAFHNQGYTTSDKSMIPGKEVPARKWFGITKQMQVGGEEFKKALYEMKVKIHLGWKKTGLF